MRSAKQKSAAANGNCCRALLKPKQDSINDQLASNIQAVGKSHN